MINDKCESVSGGQEDIDPTERAPGSCKRLASHALVIAVCGGVVIGFGLGFALRQTHLSEDAMMWTGLPGEIFMRMLKVTILPVIVCSIIHGTATMDPRSHGRVSLLTLGFVFLANTVGSLTGILCYFIVRPSEGLVVEDVTQYTSVSTDIQPQDMFADLIRNIFPDNILTACFQKTQTRYDLISEFNSTNTRLSRSIGTAAGTNVLGVLFMSAVIGTASSTLGEKGKIVVDFFEAFSAIFIKMLTWFMWSTPVGVASLIAVSVARVVDIEDTFSSLGLLVVAFLTGIIFHQLVLYPVLLLTIFRMNPLYFYLKSAKAWMAVFGPPSSAIGIPEILRLCEEDFTVDKRVSRILCSMSSLAVPAVPSASLVVVLIILTSVNVDSGAMGILFTLEWFTDRLRTTSNSMANIICTMTVDKLCKGKLEVVPTDKTQQPNVDSCDSDSDTDGTKSVLLKII
ncbi:putative sodium-dependent excitatory amino acid transporter glt-6 isoform X2 [Mizuhopecten yessoensis]|uniref:putative sodium-dependent excitatory amino acid transporter glt-6 isoform X2 n=1 Tax=Mizuhopecten yessoensis TaxID=6573 RepID=UPI000B45E02E|nr:putative sodium-dependent excitatory amino acid transporter glt-6 isoform X2 [Mizuhopecten yessoensis]